MVVICGKDIVKIIFMCDFDSFVLWLLFFLIKSLNDMKSFFFSGFDERYIQYWKIVSSVFREFSSYDYLGMFEVFREEVDIFVFSFLEVKGKFFNFKLEIYLVVGSSIY